MYIMHEKSTSLLPYAAMHTTSMLHVLTINSLQVASVSTHDPSDTHYLTARQLVSTDTVEICHGLKTAQEIDDA